MSYFALLLILLICLCQVLHSAKDYWSESFDEGKIFDLKNHVKLSPLLLNLLPKPNFFLFFFQVQLHLQTKPIFYLSRVNGDPSY